MTILSVEIETVHSDEAILFIEQLSQELAARYEEDLEEGKGAFNRSDIDVPNAAFIVARLNGQPIGCGAIRPFHEQGIAEVKRMFVSPTVRGRGIGKQILAKLEDTAHSFGYNALILETGVRQPEAIALYEKAGYKRRSCWGKYVNNEWSICYQKKLTVTQG